MSINLVIPAWKEYTMSFFTVYWVSRSSFEQAFSSSSLHLIEKDLILSPASALPSIFPHLFASAAPAAPAARWKIPLISHLSAPAAPAASATPWPLHRGNGVLYGIRNNPFIGGMSLSDGRGKLLSEAAFRRMRYAAAFLIEGRYAVTSDGWLQSSSR